MNLGPTQVSLTYPFVLNQSGANLITLGNNGTVDWDSGGVVAKTGNQIITGAKTFANVVTLNVAGNSVTHALRADRNIFAGSGLIGGGQLTSDRTISLGTGYGILVAGSETRVNTTVVVVTTGVQNISGAKTFQSQIKNAANGNVQSDPSSYVAAGYNNTTNGGQSFIGGGFYNTAYTAYTAIGGGQYNNLSGTHSFIGAGFTNSNIKNFSFIGGGSNNLNSGLYASIVGGVSGITSGDYSFIGGGQSNKISANHSSILGGKNNLILAPYSNVNGGENNIVSGNYSAIGGGYLNKTSGSYSVIGGGSENFIDANAIGSFVGCGAENYIFGETSFIGGGYNNIIYGIGKQHNVIVGGASNNCTGNYQFIGGGLDNNIISGDNQVIVGGQFNTSSANFSFIGGGGEHFNSGEYSSILGGRKAKIPASHAGSTVIADGQNRDHFSRAANACTLDFAAGVYFTLPAFAGASNQTGKFGEMAVSGSGLYICTGTAGSGWGRVFLSSF